MAQIGKCSNRVGCTLAYTGKEIRFEGSPVCPECGQPLSEVTAPKKSSKLWLLILIAVALLAMAGVGFWAVEKLTGNDTKASPTPTATPTATATPTTTPTATPTATPTPTPAPATPPPTPGPSQTQTPPPNNNQGNNVPQGQNTPNGNGSPQPSGTANGGNNGGQAVNTKPTQLSAADVETTKQEVLKRINAMPKMSTSEKTKLIDKVETAKSMKRISIVAFNTGSAELPRPEADELVNLFKGQELQEAMSDPTLVFIVAGYADLSGDPAGNLKLSEARAQSVANVLSDNAGVMNLVRTVGMGGTDLLSNRRADQNRAVEIWEVIP
jgi:outer membrane protein OmpA-like peptidoglycan-associated protein